jgi:polyhydroxybutyrate depolymerase
VSRVLQFDGQGRSPLSADPTPRQVGTANAAPHRPNAHLRVAFVVLLFASLVGASAPPSAADCRTNTLAPGDATFTMMFGGRSRSFDIHVPPGYTGMLPVALVLDLHGLGSNPRQQAAISGFREKSDQVGFLVAYPRGVANSWNAYGCCGSADLQNIDDVGFLKAVVDQISSMGRINHGRVYITGLSNGGFMSHRMACEAADVFAAAAPVSAPLNLNDPTQCRPVRPITVVHFHGLRDTTVPYAGGGILGFQSAQNSLGSWANINGCVGSATVLSLGGPSLCETFTSCSEGAHSGLCSLDGTHVLYGSQSALNIADYAWDNVFSRHTLPLGDQDADGVPDRDDNCVSVANPDQADANGNCIGDLCEALRPNILRAAVSGKRLFVYGENFHPDAVIIVNDEEKKTINDDQNPTTVLIGKKAGKRIAIGDTVRLQVKNSNGSLSDEFSFTRLEE